MKRFFFLLLILIFSCNGEKKTLPANKAGNGAGELNLIPDELPMVDTLPGDPTFIETKEIVSMFGPHSITRNMLQDKNGNIWFATWQGIMCYDGKFFTNMTLQAGLKHFHVFSILEDKSGNLWFGTVGGGVYRYNPKAANGKAWAHLTTADGLAGNSVFCMLSDKDGYIWFGTTKGASRYDPKATNGKAFTNFTERDGLERNLVNAMIQDKNGTIWIGTRGGLNLFDGKTISAFTGAEDLPFANVCALMEDKKGNILFGAQSGFWQYDPVAGKNALANLSTNFVGSIMEDKAGNDWIAEGNYHDMTVTKYDGASFTKIASSVAVFSVIEDRDGNIWYSTMNGVCRYTPNATNGKMFTDFLGQPVGK